MILFFFLWMSFFQLNGCGFTHLTINQQEKYTLKNYDRNTQLVGNGRGLPKDLLLARGLDFSTLILDDIREGYVLTKVSIFSLVCKDWYKYIKEDQEILLHVNRAKKCLRRFLNFFNASLTNQFDSENDYSVLRCIILYNTYFEPTITWNLIASNFKNANYSKEVEEYLFKITESDLIIEWMELLSEQGKIPVTFIKLLHNTIHDEHHLLPRYMNQGIKKRRYFYLKRLLKAIKMNPLLASKSTLYEDSLALLISIKHVNVLYTEYKKKTKQEHNNKMLRNSTQHKNMFRCLFQELIRYCSRIVSLFVQWYVNSINM